MIMVMMKKFFGVGGVARGGGGRRLGLHPKLRGGFVARMLLGAPPPDPY